MKCYCSQPPLNLNDILKPSFVCFFFCHVLPSYFLDCSIIFFQNSNYEVFLLFFLTLLQFALASHVLHTYDLYLIPSYILMFSLLFETLYKVECLLHGRFSDWQEPHKSNTYKIFRTLLFMDLTYSINNSYKCTLICITINVEKLV
jgi:hypothetical protein